MYIFMEGQVIDDNHLPPFLSGKFIPRQGDVLALRPAPGKQIQLRVALVEWDYDEDNKLLGVILHVEAACI